MEALSSLRLIIFSNPEKAPPQINKILVVSMARKSPRGFFRPFIEREQGENGFRRRRAVELFFGRYMQHHKQEGAKRIITQLVLWVH